MTLSSDREPGLESDLVSPTRCHCGRSSACLASQLQSDAEEIAYALRGARDNSVNQKNSDEWGVHFDNAASPTGFFAVFEGANYASGKNIVRTNLSSSVIFKNPPVASSTDIIFSKMAGLPSSAASIIISLNNSSSTKAITVNSSGEISY